MTPNSFISVAPICMRSSSAAASLCISGPPTCCMTTRLAVSRKIASRARFSGVRDWFSVDVDLEGPADAKLHGLVAWHPGAYAASDVHHHTAQLLHLCDIVAANRASVAAVTTRLV